MNGDILTDLYFDAFYEKHAAGNCLFAISSYIREQVIDYGVLEADQHRRLTAFREEPRDQHEVSMGIYMVNRETLSFIAEGVPFGFDKLMMDLLRAKLPVNVSRYDGYWLDIGRPADYRLAIEQFEAQKGRFLYV